MEQAGSGRKHGEKFLMGMSDTEWSDLVGSNGNRDQSNDAGKSQSQIAAEDAAFRKAQQDKNLENDSGQFKANRINDENTYHSPGSADVGGSPGEAKVQSDFFKNGNKRNDTAQKTNEDAQTTSRYNMVAERGTVAPENATLLGRQNDARLAQLNAVDLNGQAARGDAPSAADASMGMQLNDNMASMASAAGSARGLGALNSAQGASGLGMAGTQAALQGGMGRSKEINDAMGVYGQSAGNMVQGDINRLSQGDSNSVANVKLNDEWQEGNANLGVAQGKLGLSQQQSDDAWFNQSQEPMKRQMQYDSRMNAIQNGANLDKADALRAARQASEDRNRALIGGGVTTGLTLGGTVAGGPGGGMFGSMVGNTVNGYITGKR